MCEFLVEAKVLECRGANSDEETYLKQGNKVCGKGYERNTGGECDRVKEHVRLLRAIREDHSEEGYLSQDGKHNKEPGTQRAWERASERTVIVM